jgi:molybdate transport system regulatory protein
MTELGLEPGRKAFAIIKSSFIDLRPSERGRPKILHNRFPGTIRRRVDAERNGELLLDIGHGKSLAAVIPRAAADQRGLALGDRAVATFEAADAILAVE